MIPRLALPLLWLTCIASTAAAADRISIVYPPDKSLVTQSPVRVIGLAPEGVKSVTVSSSGGDAAGGSTFAVNKGAFSFLFKPARGANSIRVSGGSPERSAVTELAYDPGKTAGAGGFRRQYAHARLDLTEHCEECHIISRRGTPSYTRINPNSGCLSGSCHPKFVQARFVHGPVGGGSCTGCHNPHGSSRPFFVSRGGRDLCFTCHTNEEKRFTGAFVHSPVAEGECTSCHDPHQSDVKFQLKGGSQAGLCASCHGGDRSNHKFLHGPVGTGNCVACHNPHASPYAKLLYQEKEAVCFLCHKDRQEEFKRKHVHKPVSKDCGLCHDPHGSDHRFQLRNDLKTAGGAAGQTAPCLSCHEKMNPKLAAKILKSEVPHKPVREGNCTACHTAHSTDYEHQLKAPLKQLCFTCHVEMGDFIAGNKYKHGPVDQSDCAACHEVHGSSHTKLLLDDFPAEFYTPYATKKYSICFNCHNEKVSLDKWSKETDFRNGNRNLHYVHVNREKGRSCKACHEVHAGNQQKHVREEVPYGKGWNYPINYTRSPEGGTCVVGCHKPLSYDRVNEVKY